MTLSIIETLIEAPRSLVFEIFADRERSGEYLPVRTSLVSPGTVERQGVGAIHRIGFGPIRVREQITELVCGERVIYQVVGGLPVRRHVGTIEFSDDEWGTRVRYTLEVQPSIPVSESLVAFLLRTTAGVVLSRARRAALSRSMD
ncbi:SRPBCC family protein [Nocardia sp. NPDC004722]